VYLGISLAVQSPLLCLIGLSVDKIKLKTAPLAESRSLTVGESVPNDAIDLPLFRYCLHGVSEPIRSR